MIPLAGQTQRSVAHQSLWWSDHAKRPIERLSSASQLGATERPLPLTSSVWTEAVLCASSPQAMQENGNCRVRPAPTPSGFPRSKVRLC